MTTVAAPAGRPRFARLRWLAWPLALGLAAASAGCSTATNAAGSGGTARIPVVAAENFWGSILGQLGGDRIELTTLIKDPNADPHEYEPAPADGRAVASARYVLINGAGYDPWVSKLLAAGADPRQRVLDVGRLVGVGPGGNPHRWYSPGDVNTVIAQISSDLTAIDPAGGAYYAQRRDAFQHSAMSRYNQLVSTIKQHYAGVPVGASESIFAPMAGALGLDLMTPQGFLDAVSEGSDPTARDKATTDAQVTGRQIKVFVYNRQNATPDVRAVVNEANAAGIPVTTVTETLTPPTASFQDWQADELDALRAALAKATGR
jgi:zinc/manganese transport system substrate-binding protein